MVEAGCALTFDNLFMFIVAEGFLPRQERNYSMSITSLGSRPATAAPFTHLITRHPLVAFFVLAYAGAWLMVLPLLLARNGFGWLPFTLPTEVFLLLGAFTGPMFAALVVTARLHGKAGVWLLLRRCVQWRVGVHCYLIVFLGYPFLYLLVSCLLLGTAPLHSVIHHWPLFFTLYLPLALTLYFIGAVGEETGWRGFALPRLQQKYGPLWGSLILGTLHALWHLPGFFGGWLGAFTLPRFGVFLLTIVAVTVIWTWVFNQAQGSILIAILLHSTSNAVYPWIIMLIPTAAAASPAFLGEAGLLVDAAFILFALLIIACTRGRLSYQPNKGTLPATASLSAS